MRTTSNLTAAAVALVAGIGPVSTDQHIDTLAGLSSHSLPPAELAELVGEGSVEVPVQFPDDYSINIVISNIPAIQAGVAPREGS